MTTDEPVSPDAPTCVTIHADGACLGNPGPGGHAAIIRWWQHQNLLREEELSGGEHASTNNRMELSAVIAGLERVFADDPPRTLPIEVNSDSEYVTLNARTRLPRWKLNGWRTSAKKPVKNAELWRTLDALCEGRNIIFRWVKGHNGDPMNERADALASAAAELFRRATAA